MRDNFTVATEICFESENPFNKHEKWSTVEELSKLLNTYGRVNNNIKKLWSSESYRHLVKLTPWRSEGLLQAVIQSPGSFNNSWRLDATAGPGNPKRISQVVMILCAAWTGMTAWYRVHHRPTD